MSIDEEQDIQYEYKQITKCCRNCAQEHNLPTGITAWWGKCECCHSFTMIRYVTS